MSIEKLYKDIISDSVTKDQVFVLDNLFEEFKYLLKDNNLSNLSNDITDDGDILLTINTENYLVNLIIHPEDDFALSIINKKSEDSIEFFDINNVDFKEVSLNFTKYLQL